MQICEKCGKELDVFSWGKKSMASCKNQLCPEYKHPKVPEYCSEPEVVVMVKKRKEPDPNDHKYRRFRKNKEEI
jgi:hypothetical protein